jgi:hypothetical protein
MSAVDFVAYHALKTKESMQTLTFSQEAFVIVKSVTMYSRKSQKLIKKVLKVDRWFTTCCRRFYQYRVIMKP